MDAFVQTTVDLSCFVRQNVVGLRQSLQRLENLKHRFHSLRRIKTRPLLKNIVDGKFVNSQQFWIVNINSAANDSDILANVAI